MSPQEVLKALGWADSDWAGQEPDGETARHFVSRDGRFVFYFRPFPIEGRNGEVKTQLDTGLTSVQVLCRTPEELEEIRERLSEKFSPPTESERGRCWVLGGLWSEHPGFSEYCRVLQDWYRAVGMPSGAQEDFAETLSVLPLSTASLVDNPKLLGGEEISGYFVFDDEFCARLNHISELAAEWDTALKE